MSEFMQTLSSLDFNNSGVPIGKITITVIILTITQMLRRFLVSSVVRTDRV